MEKTPRLGALYGYVGSLCAVHVGVIVYIAIEKEGLGVPFGVWIFLSVLFGIAEYSLVFFHDRHARLGLSISEVVLLPMLVSMSFTGVVLGVSVAMVFERATRWRQGLVRYLFNVAQYGCSAALVAALWHALAHEQAAFTIRNAAVSVLAMVLYSILTHVLTSGAIALASGEGFYSLTRAVAPATLLNLAGSIVAGLLLAAAYSASSWTLVLFPALVLALYVGYRAMLRQSGERERVEHLHAATRALASTADLGRAIEGFLRAVSEVVSSSQALLALRNKDRVEWAWMGKVVDGSDGDPVGPDEIEKFLRSFEKSPGGIVINDEGDGPAEGIRKSLGVRNLIAVPVLEGESVAGCLIVADRVGADDFDEADVRLIEALANELVLSLESHRLFQAVSEERERFRRTFEGSREGISLVDKDGRVFAWNPALERISGYTEAAMLGQIWSDKVTIRDRNERRVEGAGILTVAADAELELVTREGPTQWISVNSGPVQTSEGQDWVVLVRDVTSEHMAEVAKSDFLATISHELRTPLTTIKGSLHALQRGPEHLSADLYEQMIGVLRRGSDRLERLVFNLLTVSQLEHEETPRVLLDQVDLEELVRERADRILDEHRGGAQFLIRDQGLEVRADRERLGHSVEHVIDNAFKFGGPEGEITVQIWRDNGYARVSVTDQGPGIPSADHQRIFERFVRLGELMTRETQGAGVGLFIAKRSIEAMGGSIWVESEVGRGATFHIRVPLARPVVVSDTA